MGMPAVLASKGIGGFGRFAPFWWGEPVFLARNCVFSRFGGASCKLMLRARCEGSFRFAPYFGDTSVICMPLGEYAGAFYVW